MALDAIVLSGIIAELSPKLCRARIDKLQQPERDKIILSVRGGSENMRILIDAGAGSGRLQQTRPARSPDVLYAAAKISRRRQDRAH